MRGGAFNNNRNNIRLPYRNNNNPDNRNNNQGFRLSRSDNLCKIAYAGIRRSSIVEACSCDVQGLFPARVTCFNRYQPKIENPSTDANALVDGKLYDLHTGKSLPCLRHTFPVPNGTNAAIKREYFAIIHVITSSSNGHS
ncbi:hypothetical protein JW960_29630 [candidate division KSB1 bacterium]|nr:hypothetical protein [candidate division KSB1 bacterium]